MSHPDPVKAKAIEAAMADGWPLIEIQRTVRVNWATLRRHYPTYPGMPRGESAKLGAAARHANMKTRSSR